MNSNFIRIFKQKSGVAIMAVMLFFMVMMIMIGALTIYSQGNLRLSGVSAQNTASYYAAEAGIKRVVNDFEELMNDSTLTLAQFVSLVDNVILYHESNPRVDLSDNAGAESYAMISFIDKFHNQVSRTFGFTIVSTGFVNGQTRTLETLVDLEYGSLTGSNQGFAIRHAVLVRNSITTSNNSVITLSNTFAQQNPNAVSRIATYATTNNAVNMAGNTSFSGFIELVQGASNNVVSSNFRSLIDPNNRVVNTTFAQLDFGPIRTLADSVPTSSRIPAITGLVRVETNGNRNIEPTASSTVSNPYVIPGGSYYVPSIEFGNTNVVIRADNDVFIVTESLTLGNATFIGEGEITIYVKQGSNTFSFPSSNGSFFGNQLKPYLLVIYVDQITPTPTFTLTNNSTIYGSFMFKNASLNFSNNTTFGGYLMTEGANVTLSNNGAVTTTFYYVPLGSVTLSQNATVRGAVIANNATLLNGSIVQYDPDFLTNFPFSVSSPVANNSPSENYGIKILRIHRTTER
jgi:hypothetical protein